MCQLSLGRHSRIGRYPFKEEVVPRKELPIALQQIVGDGLHAAQDVRKAVAELQTKY